MLIYSTTKRNGEILYFDFTDVIDIYYIFTAIVTFRIQIFINHSIMMLLSDVKEMHFYRLNLIHLVKGISIIYTVVIYNIHTEMGHSAWCILFLLIFLYLGDILNAELVIDNIFTLWNWYSCLSKRSKYVFHRCLHVCTVIESCVTETAFTENFPLCASFCCWKCPNFRQKFQCDEFCGHDTYTIFTSFIFYTVRHTVLCYLQNWSGSLQLDFWWGLSARSACTKHQQHVSLARVLHPSFASESPSRQTPLSENLQMQVHDDNFLKSTTWIRKFERTVLSDTHWLMNEEKWVAWHTVPALYFILTLLKFSNMTGTDSFTITQDFYICTALKGGVWKKDWK